MQIKMNTSAAGPNGSYQEGHVYDVPNQISQEQADDFVRGGYAAALSAPYLAAIAESLVGYATAAPAETAAAIPQRNKRRHK